MDIIRLAIFGIVCFCSIQLISTKGWIVYIDRIEYENYREDVITNIRSEMHKISRTESAPTVHFTLLREMSNIILSVGLYQINGVQKSKLPFNITGDLCNFIAKDFLVIKDIKKLGLTNCPLEAKEWVLEKIKVDAKNLPNLRLIGHFMLKFVFFYENKPLAMANIYLTTRDGGKSGTKNSDPPKFIDNSYREYYPRLSDTL
ncbi:uncharacterized protein LOC123296460 [Chrysoperla carnea]|uniref:uncharacterized protein LOC123296460 n=1 Tax=Chrysoperla carnea TaxID=189513 RepID=UPI001D07B691|nr:uncharacterized protein LOC123296460 [Chrysoperla carnea]